MPITNSYWMNQLAFKAWMSNDLNSLYFNFNSDFFIIKLDEQKAKRLFINQNWNISISLNISWPTVLTKILDLIQNAWFVLK